MNCPVCDRSLAPTLSICPACGAMMNDTVREELQSKITTGCPPRVEAKSEPMPAPMPSAPRPSMMASPRPTMSAPPPVRRHETADLISPKTSPTLVEFQTKSASLPDWRLQLQNAVQQRKGGHSTTAVAATANHTFPTNGGAALKAELVTQPDPEMTTKISDPRVANAMRRIDESRNAFLEPQAAAKKPLPARPAPMRSFPFDVVSPNGRGATAAAPARVPAPVNATPKPKLVVPQPAPVMEKRDTNKLPPLPQPAAPIAEPVAPPIERVVELKEPVIEKAVSAPLPMEFGDIKRIQIRAEHAEIEPLEQADIYDDEIEDLAPFSMRFGAGLFDLIISAFTAALLLSPFAFSGANWSTASGLLTFTATWAIVSFIYMTTCVGLYGKTLGMRLFSLELVDALENEYPTLHQAAINSSVFLLSLVFAGMGFITAFFNEERRAIHDLLSGTIIVREF